MTAWLRTSAQATFYGYEATTRLEGRNQWAWRVVREGHGKVLAAGETKRESSARQAARRWILAQPDAKAAHEESTRCHWNGRAIGLGEPAASWRNSDLSERWRGACGALTGLSSNYVVDRPKFNCPKCLELLAASEAHRAQAAP